jgi:CRISPR type III-B/RAMP module RAMP protein Cmr6
MIPLAKDTRDAVGAFAAKVENRSLLFQKMVLAKSWGHEARFNDANRFNVLRACSSGGKLLTEDRNAAAHKAAKGGKNADAAAYKAKVAADMASVRVENPDLASRQTENSLHLLSLLEKSFPGKSDTFVGELGGRLLINMAGGVQENAGMALDRCFGLPFIPGPAVKGVTRHTALWDIRRTTGRDQRKEKLRLALLAFGFVSGDISKGKRGLGDFLWAADGDGLLLREAGDPFAQNDSFKGLLSFLPAYPASTPEIIAEVLTPHPRASLAAQGKGDPRPIFFPAVKEGSTFGFAIVASRSPEGAPVAKVLKQAGIWLRTAITAQGIGAKTGAGYGWFIINPQAEQARRAAIAEMARKTEEDRIKALADVTAAETLANTQAVPAIMERLRILPLDQLRARLNKFEFADHRFWPTAGEDADPAFQLSLLQLLLTNDALRVDLGSKAKGAKALKNLAAKFNRVLP